MKNKYVSVRDVLIFILGILTAVFFWVALVTIRRIFWMLFKLCFTAFILMVIIKISYIMVKKKKNTTK